MSATQQEATTGVEPRGWRLAGKQAVLHWPLTALAAWAVLLLGGALRFYHLDALSYWLDEGNTVYDTRRDWDVVLGFQGRYTEHPPLYHALVKLLAVVFPDNIAARVFSFICGTLTVVVLYPWWLRCSIAGRLSWQAWRSRYRRCMSGTRKRRGCTRPRCLPWLLPT